MLTPQGTTLNNSTLLIIVMAEGTNYINHQQLTIKQNKHLNNRQSIATKQPIDCFKGNQLLRAIDCPQAILTVSGRMYA